MKFTFESEGVTYASLAEVVFLNERFSLKNQTMLSWALPFLGRMKTLADTFLKQVDESELDRIPGVPNLMLSVCQELCNSIESFVDRKSFDICGYVLTEGQSWDEHDKEVVGDRKIAPIVAVVLVIYPGNHDSGVVKIWISED